MPAGSPFAVKASAFTAVTLATGWFHVVTQAGVSSPAALSVSTVVLGLVLVLSGWATVRLDDRFQGSGSVVICQE